jgi:hypothetical protein
VARREKELTEVRSSLGHARPVLGGQAPRSRGQRRRLQRRDRGDPGGDLEEVRDSALEVGVARERLRVATEEAAVAEETARTARRGFSAGLSTSLEVIDALDRETHANVGLEQARAGLGQALAALRLARGLDR